MQGAFRRFSDSFLVVMPLIELVLLLAFPVAIIPLPILLALAMLLGLVVYINLVHRGWVGPAFLGVLVIWATLANSGAYKLTVPGLEAYYPARTLMRLLRREKTYGARPTTELASYSQPSRWWGLSNRTVLERWRTGLAQSGDRRPKLAVVATSGGGLRAAVWTATVLRRLEVEAKLPEFPRHLRLITGASGGMLGAAYYTTRLLDGPTVHRHQAAEDLGESDFLAPTLSRLLIHDVPWILVPWRQSWDRGRELEAAWLRKTDGSLGRTFDDLRRAEERGAIPSLVFSPMMVEDGRRLLISNLDLDTFTGARGPLIGESEGDALYSRSGVEFFRLFPQAAPTFQVATAASPDFSLVNGEGPDWPCSR
jgi:hypothetical protein